MDTNTLLLLLATKMLLVLSIYADAKSDAIIDKTAKRNHLLEAIQIGALLLALVPVSWLIYNYFDRSGYTWWWLVKWVPLSYLFLRMGLFNMIYGKIRINDFSYIGTTDKFYDKPLQYLKKWEDANNWPIIKGFPFLIVWYFVCILFGLFIH